MIRDSPAIEVHNITKRFGKLVAVNNVNFSVAKGEIFGFLGPNGAGKTTTIRMLTGILIPDAGRVIIEGIDMEKDPIRAKMKMGIIPEIGNVYVDLTTRQNLLLSGRFYGLSKSTIEKRSEEMLSALGLSERSDDPVRTCSKGMKQRISIACAIIHEPCVLLLDEPTEGLDVQSRRLIIDTISKMNDKGSTIFLTTHNIEEANRLCKKVCIINKGKIVAINTPERLKNTFDKTQSIEVAFNKHVNSELLASTFISKIDICGDKVHLYTNDPDRTVKHVVSLAEKNGLRILSMTTCGPSLEEAFIKLTGGKK